MAQRLCETRATLRQLANEFGCAPQTVLYGIERVKEFDMTLYSRSRAILDYHKMIRHIRGGEATKVKYRRKSA
jgi:putative DeoR family transcriptional regulator (stage III sporulation protein D)